MKVNIWSASGTADHAAEQAEALAGHFDISRVLEGTAAPPADLDLYHLANSPDHGLAYRAALVRPGVVVLHEWNLCSLACGEAASYLRDMRRAHGEPGSFVARQVLRGLGGDLWPSLYPLNHPVLEASLGVVTLTNEDAERVTLGFHGLPALALPRGSDAEALADFLRQVFENRDRLARSAASRRPPEGSLNARLLDEARAARHELGLGSLSLGIEPLLTAG